MNCITKKNLVKSDSQEGERGSMQLNECWSEKVLHLGVFAKEIEKSGSMTWRILESVLSATTRHCNVV